MDRMKPMFRTALLAAALCSGAAPALTQAQAVKIPPATGAAQPKTPDLENAGKLAAHAWLALLDRRDWGTAWDTSSQVFRQTVPLGSWMDAVPKVREPFGPFVEREALEAVYKTTLPGRPDGQYVSVMFASKFAKQAIREVVTTVREPDGRFRVIGYNPAKP